MRVDAPSRTAEGIAAARARESAKPEAERIFYDPYAQYFLGLRYRLTRFFRPLALFFRWRNARTLPGMFGGLVVRTRYIDDHLLRCVAQGTEQVVILGAGYDARAYRFKDRLAGVQIFEVDHPATQQVKIAKLRRIFGKIPAHVIYVPSRFNSQRLDRLLPESGYDPQRNSLFIWEGVTMYLSGQGVDNTLAFIAGFSPPGSSVVFDYFPPSVAGGTCTWTEVRTLRKMVARLGEEIRFGIDPEDVEAFLTCRGFHRVETIDGQTCELRYFPGSGAGPAVSGLFHFAHARVAPR